MAHLTATCRTTDPATSRQAATLAESTGKAASHRNMLLNAILATPGATSGELASQVGILPHEAQKRLPELCKACSITRGLPRKCSVCGTQQATYWPAKPKPAPKWDAEWTTKPKQSSLF